ncbi:lantibiotic dehydratase [Chryseobacterium sp.]|uniref:lantibiotic dehydratase n=1 Tax=Chryseobacterium sp. TaxID=1871047 RepID=UPI0025C236A7|nr:lantibiotic dehydratase [Chryseobacterium sp.]MBV8326781.1 lantibiotic dehydratase [Chryseobacterium sp.]
MLTPENFYLLRAPYLPVSIAEKILNNPDLTQEILTELCQDQDIKQAIFLASPALFNELETYLSQENKHPKMKKVEQSILKYIIRASFRSTPYGMFSGVSLGTLEDTTNIILNEKNKHISIIRLDMQLLDIIVQNIAAREDVQSALKFYPNSSSYLINGRLHYFESQMLGRTKTFNHSSIEYSEYINEIIVLARDGATKEEFRNCFDLDEFDVDEIDAFIDELIDNEIIVHNLHPLLTGENVLDDIINKLDALQIPDLSPVLQSLIKIRETLEATVGITEKKAVIEAEIQLFGINNYDSDFFQVDLNLSKFKNQLNKKVVEEIVDQAAEIASIMPNSIVEDLENFKTHFINRYENREMPLAHVLDSEFGIGYGDSNNHTIGALELIGGITNFKNNPIQLLRLDSFHKLKYEKFYHALRQGLFEVEVTPEDIEFLKSSSRGKSVFPDSSYIMGNLIAESPEAVDAGHYKFKLDYFNGPSAVTLLARFCHTDPELIGKLKTAIKNEEAHCDAVYAEIVHAPQPRLGNVIQRPVLREYEIPFLSASGNDRDKCIDIEDLMVSISNNIVVLRSKRLDKRIIPCLSSAQNFRVASLPVYKFLCDLQHQGIMASFVWDWDAFRTAKFLPRVIYKNIILSPATWNIDKNILERYAKLTEPEDITIGFSAFRKDFKIPAKVLLVDGDNKLLVDLDNEYSLDIIYKHFQKKQHITLVETFFSSDQTVVKNTNDEGYTNEIVIPVSKVTDHTTKPAKASEKVILNNIAQRKFSLGSEWLYVKIYGGALLLDHILKTKITDLTTVLEERQLIDKWFFIRYEDPDHHHRLRFHLKDISYLNEVIELFNTILYDEISNQSIYKVQYDTYEREIERYGNDLIESCESIFWKDSTSIFEMLEIASDYSHEENSRWLFALQSLDEYLTSFKIDIEHKIKFTDILYDSFCKEFGDPKVLKQDLDNLYRKNRSVIEDHFQKNELYQEYSDILKNRNESLAGAMNEILQYYSQRNMKGIQIPIIPSIIHMSINRTFPAYQRKFEMTVYYFLNKYYKKIYYTNLV